MSLGLKGEEAIPHRSASRCQDGHGLVRLPDFQRRCTEGIAVHLCGDAPVARMEAVLNGRTKAPLALWMRPIKSATP